MTRGNNRHGASPRASAREIGWLPSPRKTGAERVGHTYLTFRVDSLFFFGSFPNQLVPYKSSPLHPLETVAEKGRGWLVGGGALGRREYVDVGAIDQPECYAVRLVLS